jgi:hypothetical protein
LGAPLIAASQEENLMSDQNKALVGWQLHEAGMHF